MLCHIVLLCHWLQNCKLGHGRRLRCAFASPNPSAVVANSCTHRRRDATKQFRLVGVGGVYWTLRFTKMQPPTLPEYSPKYWKYLQVTVSLWLEPMTGPSHWTLQLTHNLEVVLIGLAVGYLVQLGSLVCTWSDIPTHNPTWPGKNTDVLCHCVGHSRALSECRNIPKWTNHSTFLKLNIVEKSGEVWVTRPN